MIEAPVSLSGEDPRAPLLDAWYWLADSLIMAERNLLLWWRSFVFMALTLIQPIMFVLLFRFVLGSSIHVPTPGGYTDYMMPGAIGQAGAFASAGTALTLSRAMNRGTVERYRAMPIARSAFLTGRLFADAVRMATTIAVMTIIGFAIGLRFQVGWLPGLAMLGLGLLLGIVLCSASAFIGMVVRSEEAVQSYGFIWIFPVTFVSSAFVPVTALPSWLQAFAREQPFTVAIDAMRALIVGGPTAGAVWKALAWLVGLLVVFTVLAVQAYNRRSA